MSGSSLLEGVMERVERASRDPRALEEARKALIDTIAVAAAAYGLAGPPPTMHGESGGRSLVLGSWKRAGTLEAAAANGFLAHALELDDWLARGYVHAGAVVVPAIIAVGLDASLGEVLRAVAAGYEAAGAIGAMGGRGYYAVWHTTATAGSAGAAASASLLLEGHVESAIAVAVNYMGGLWNVPRRGDIKPHSTAHAAATGVLAALSTRGMKVESRVLEEACELHYFDRCMLEVLPRDPMILYNGYKFYPACRHTHSAIHAALRAREKVGGPEGVERVEVVVGEEAARVAGIASPRTVGEARFSLRYLIAASLAYGRLGLGEVERGLRDPVVKRLMEKIVVSVSDEYTEAYPERQPAMVRVHAGGSVVEEVVEEPPGYRGVNVSLEDIVGKARSLAREAGDPRIARVAEDLARAGESASLGEVLGVEPRR
ncbi:MAG: MmgE/PrpD family protein [Desulfurococcales archaeon]|nr:MmgE/PrpD family protein [Desulfurococcales archaeon]